MTFYGKLIYLLYPEYIPPDIFTIPMKNKYSILIQLILQKKKRLYIYKLIKFEEDLHMYLKLYKIQRQLSKFVTFVKYKYTKKYNDVNLYGENLKAKCIKVLENNTLYQFDYYEMIKLIKKKIFYHEHFFVMSQLPTNPYTNSPFLFHNLYNIFFQLSHSDYLIPFGLRMLFHVNFDIDKFMDKNSYNIKLFILNDEYNKISLSSKYHIMKKMIIQCKKRVFLNVSNDILFDIFKEQVKEYFKSLYMPSWCEKMMIIQIKQQLHHYHMYHPNFGKMDYNIFTNKPIVCL